MIESDDDQSPATDWRIDWGNLLRTARQVAGLSLSELSRATGLSKGYLSKLESAHPSAANPSRATLAALARALPSFGPLAHTLEPSAPLGVLAFARTPPQLPPIAFDATGAAPRPSPVKLGWRELELVIALLVAERSASTQPITALLLARGVGRGLGDVRPTLDGLVEMAVLDRLPPSRPGAAPTYRRSADFEARVGVARVGDALILAAALLASGPARHLHPVRREADDDR